MDITRILLVAWDRKHSFLDDIPMKEKFYYLFVRNFSDQSAEKAADYWFDVHKRKLEATDMGVLKMTHLTMKAKQLGVKLNTFYEVGLPEKADQGEAVLSTDQEA